MPTRTRPQLDAATAWRVDQIMRLEGRRSIADVIAAVVADYWNHVNKVEEARCVGLHADVPAEKAITVATHLPAKIAGRVERIADREHRTMSNTLRLLVSEALTSRGVFQPEGGAVEAAPVTA